MSNRFIYFISIFAFSFSAYAAESGNVYANGSSDVIGNSSNPTILADIKIDSPCTPSSTYQNVYFCSHGTRKTNTCTIYRNSSGEECRRTCESQTCRSDE